MNTRILVLAGAVVALSSCSSAYKTGQTPDDVYFSPARTQAAAAKVNEDEQSYMNVPQNKAGTYSYQSYDQYLESQRDNNFLRMSVGNPYYMNYYNSYSGFDWRYNAYYGGYNYGMYSPWNNYFAWNSFYNPYCMMPYSSFGYGMGSYYYGGGGYYVAGSKASYTTLAPISRPRVFNMNSYSPTNATGRGYTPSSYYNNGQRYNNSNGSSNSGNRSYYNNSNNNARSMYPSNSGNNNSYSPSRSYSPSSGGGGGASSGGGGGVSRPGRGN